MKTLISFFIILFCTSLLSSQERFMRGDANLDGESSDITDAVYVLQYLFLSGDSLCLDSMDVNDDGRIDITDPIVALTYRFFGAKPPAYPFSECGTDPTQDELTCKVGYKNCSQFEGICLQNDLSTTIGETLCTIFKIQLEEGKLFEIYVSESGLVGEFKIKNVGPGGLFIHSVNPNGGEELSLSKGQETLVYGTNVSIISTAASVVRVCSLSFD